MSFQEIDRRRVAAGLTRKAIYERAGVDGETWRRSASSKTEPNTKTLRKLSQALEQLEQEKADGSTV
ncbi:helix-turn-helix transcriptional regulator [Mesorhizobium sp. WSM4976]|uniref:helix-turn-helix domain-containing protein n=1 Tax=Mesorhizobium sp. WSM4976 TaxID=3038549 RepID=UPI002415AF59|nr:helix-turn-helix transcriptional regulator [Mesorhizobium sp. WSM4976]MDG4894643.1 helix-turn-helix transcriptional regulator [Mesorhizobium sp. WSM4976]